MVRHLKCRTKQVVHLLLGFNHLLGADQLPEKFILLLDFSREQVVECRQVF